MTLVMNLQVRSPWIRVGGPVSSDRHLYSRGEAVEGTEAETGGVQPAAQETPGASRSREMQEGSPPTASGRGAALRHLDFRPRAPD